MESSTTKGLHVDECVLGMKRFRALTESSDSIDAAISLDETSVAELTDLLGAVMLRDQWSDDDFDRIFDEDNDFGSIGFEVAGLISHGGAISGLPIVLQFFRWLAADGDEEWLFAEGPKVVSTESPEMAVAWIEAVGDAPNGDEVDSIIIEGLEELAKHRPPIAQAIRPIVVAMLNDSPKLCVRVTTDLMRLAVELKFKEASDAIETAFSENRIDCGMMGDWEEVRKEMQVSGQGLTMPKKPHNSMDDFRRNVGVGCFSEQPIFLSGEIQEDAVEDYLTAACDAFARSDEGQEVLSDGEGAFHVRNFLDLGVHYLGVSTETMETAEATELLLELFPRKITMDPSDCDDVIDELAAFWKYCDRVHGIESAPSIASEIAALSKRFRGAMTDPANFGMAKSFFTQGQKAGFDMTTQEGLNEFMLAYNASIGQSSPSLHATEIKALLQRRWRVESKSTSRNDNRLPRFRT